VLLSCGTSRLQRLLKRLPHSNTGKLLADVHTCWPMFHTVNNSNSGELLAPAALQHYTPHLRP
jgi:hypothetical protein